MRRKLNTGDWVRVTSLDDDEALHRYSNDIIENSRKYKGKTGNITGANVAKSGKDSSGGIEWTTEDVMYPVKLHDSGQTIILPLEALEH